MDLETRLFIPGQQNQQRQRRLFVQAINIIENGLRVSLDEGRQRTGNPETCCSLWLYGQAFAAKPVYATMSHRSKGGSINAQPLPMPGKSRFLL